MDQIEYKDSLSTLRSLQLVDNSYICVFQCKMYVYIICNVCLKIEYPMTKISVITARVLAGGHPSGIHYQDI